MPSVFLLGSTDLTLEVARTVLETGLTLDGIAHVGACFEISYAPGGVRNSRYADVPSFCAEHDIDAMAFENNAALARALAGRDVAVGLAVGWYHMVPASVRDCFARGCLGLHASLLPELRGGAPLNWAILTGLTRTGVTLFELDNGVDDGPIYGQVEFPIGPRTDIGDLVRASAQASHDLVRDCLPGILDGSRSGRPQSGAGSWGLQRAPEDGRIDWRTDTDAIDRLVRAVSRPYPGARCRAGTDEVVIWKAEPAAADVVIHGAPGQVLRRPGDARPFVVTGDGAIRVLEATRGDDDALPLLLGMNHQRLA